MCSQQVEELLPFEVDEVEEHLTAPNRKPLARDFRVVMTSRIFLPEPAAASFRLGAVYEALVEEGAEVTVLTTEPALTPEMVLTAESPQIKRWPVLRDKTGYVRGYLPYMSFDIPLFFRLLAERRPDVILVEPPPTTGAVTRVVAALKRVPYVWYAADIWSDATEITGAPKPVVSMLRFIEKFAIRGAAGIIAVSDGVGKRVAELGGKNIRVIPNGIDTDVYTTRVEPLEAGELAEFGIVSPYLIYAGTASEWQGASVFAEAMRSIASTETNLQVIFVGQGTEWDSIQEISAELQATYGRDVIIQVPPVSPLRVAELLAGAEGALVSIVPGQGYDFAYPTKVLAALASGKPVVFAGTGPAASDIESLGLGIVTDYDPIKVADAMTRLAPRSAMLFSPERLRSWVIDNKSMRAMGTRAADFILSTAKCGASPQVGRFVK